MKKWSLRFRLTLATAIIITAIAVMLTLVSMYQTSFVAVQTASAVNVDDDFYAVEESVGVYGIADESISAAASMDDTLMEEYNADTAPVLGGYPSSTYSDGYTLPSSVAIVVQQFNETNLFFMCFIIGAGIIITWFALGRALKPVRDLSDKITGISENDLDVRITDFEAGDEINRLAHSFNHMLERLEGAFEAQKGFASAAAHELKTPLATIKASLDVLEIGDAPQVQEYERAAEVTRKQTERMIALVDDLFQVSMSQYDFKDSVNLAELVQDALQEQKPQIEDKKISVYLYDHTKNLLTGNAGMLSHAIGNVISNAVKYNKDKGTVSIHINQNEHDYTIKVSDTGIGIPEDQREKVFEAFYRIDSSRSRKVGGAGMGLAITKKMVDAHGGSVVILEGEDGGTSVKITLPKI
ncbi:HAMP domain-containing histidine kinase [Christensenellaceae bacterium OttesenSCG-928-K19]|nr:HAMP domain-containing histidine kinase [Christensenellaceae bacterium OttesenSCG-928-K19]